MDDQRILAIAQQAIRQKVVDDCDWLPELDQPWLQKKTGVFTTLHTTAPERQLRGCVGVPYPDHPLGHAIALSARRSATEDPRFPPVVPEEIDTLSMSVEVLSEFTPIEYSNLADLMEQIEIGSMGLTVRYSDYAALFLPRVAIEQEWDVHEYVVNLCRKGYIPPAFIGIKDVEFSSFTTQLFSI